MGKSKDKEFFFFFDIYALSSVLFLLMTIFFALVSNN